MKVLMQLCIQCHATTLTMQCGMDGYTDNSNSHNRIDKFHNFSDLNVTIYPITKSGTAFEKNTYSIKLLVV